MTDALSAAFPWLQEASDIDPRHLALRPIAWEHSIWCDCRVCKIRRAAERARNLPAGHGVEQREEVTI